MKAQSKNGAAKTALRSRNAATPKSASSRSKTVEIPSRWRANYRALSALREQLSAAWHERLKDAAEPSEVRSMHPAEMASGAFERERALVELAREQLQLHEVEAAMRRIEAGTYGICESSGKHIPAARLKALPWTRFCKEAELRLERAVGSEGRA